MKEMWDDRYSDKEYAYGIEPNDFFKNSIEKHQLTGDLLMPAEGEGRNAVYAAKKGLTVSAFDISVAGKKKALKLAEQENVTIHYEVGDFYEMELGRQTYDAIGLIFAHFPPTLLSPYHKKLAGLLKPNGLIILEGFSTTHLNYQKEYPNIGGPKAIEMLFSTISIQGDFEELEILQLEEVEVELNEGIYHKGKGSVIRFVGRKKG